MSFKKRSIRRGISAAVAAAIAAFTPAGLGADFTWDNTTGNWSDPARWGGVAPVSSAANTLIFGSGAADYISTYDGAALFQLNKLQLSAAAGRYNAVTATTLTNTLDFLVNGVNQPAINMSGGGTFRIGQNVRIGNGATLNVNVAAGSNLVFAASSPSPATSSQTITAVGGTTSLVLEGGGTLVWRSLTIANPIINNGLVLTDGNGDFLGSGTTLTIGANGIVDTGGFAEGWLAIQGAAGGIFRGSVDVNAASGTFVYGGTIINRPAGVAVPGFGTVGGVASTATLTKSGGHTLVLQGTSTYTGATALSGGTTVLSGAAGAITGTSGTTVSAGALLQLDNTGSNSNDRYRNAATLTLTRGNFSLLGSSATDTTESIGALTVNAGPSTISVTPGSGRTATLTIASIGTRAAGGILNITGGDVVIPGTVVGSSATSLGGWLLLNGEFATRNVSNVLIPVTYQTAADATTWATTDHVKVTGPLSAQPGAAQTAIGSLNLAAATTLDLSGIGAPLSITSGGIAASANATITGGSIRTGSVAAGLDLAIHVSAGNTLTIASAIENNTAAVSPLTKGGEGTLLLTGTNTYTGVTHVGEGTLILAGPGTLTGTANVQGGATFQIGNGGTTGFLSGNITDAGALVFNRSDDITYAGVISSTGNVTKMGTGALTLTGASTFTGGTTISNGRIVVARDTVSSTTTDGLPTGTVTNGPLGTGAVTLDGGLLTPDATSRAILNALVFNGPGNTIDVPSGLEFTTTGTTAGTGTVTKTGTGLWRITSLSSTFTGTLNVNAGAVLLSDPGASTGTGGNLDANSIIINSGGTFTFGQGGVTSENPDHPDATFLTVNTGGTLVWNVGEQIGGIHLAGGTLTINASPNMNGAAVNWTSGTINGTTPAASILTGAAAINKTGPGTVTVNLATINNTAGALNIMEGTISLNGGLTGAGPVTLGGGATAGTLQYVGALSAALNKPFTVNAGGGVVDITTAGITLTYQGAAGGTGMLTKAGAGILALSGTNTYAGGTTISAGTLQVGAAGVTGSIVGNVVNNGTLAFNRTDNITFPGDISGTGGLTKSQANTLLLTGTMSYAGPTAISAGTLQVRPFTASAVTVGPAATFAIANPAAPVTMTASTVSLDAAGSTIRFLLNSAANPAVPLLNVTTPDGLALNGGAHTINISNAQPFATGTFTLIDYAGAPISSGFTLTGLSARTIGMLQYDTANTQINLNITGSDSIKWAGDLSADWDTGTAVDTGGTNNWRRISNNTATNFIAGDQVLFDDSSVTTTVNIPAVVQPSQVVVNNTNLAYTFSGTGEISGTGQLVKQGTNSLTLLVNSTNTGGTLVSGGTLLIGNGGIVGAPSPGAFINNAAVIWNRNDDVTFTGDITGTGTLTKQGNNILAVAGAYTLAGDTTLNGGILAIGNAAGFTHSGKITGAGAVNKEGAGTVVLSGNNDYAGQTNINAGGLVLLGTNTGTGQITMVSGTTLTIGNGGTTGSLVADVFAVGAVTFNRSDASAYPGVISGTGTLVKQGAGTLVTTGNHTNTGTTTVSAGTLQFGNGVTGRPGTGNIAVGVNGNLVLNPGANYTISAILSGAGNVTKNGPGTITFTAANTNTGVFTINGGTVILDGTGTAGDLDNSSIVINNGGTFLVTFTTLPANPDLPGGTFITINTGGVAEFRIVEDYGGIILKGGEYKTNVNHNFGAGFTSIFESGALTNTAAGLGGIFAGAGAIQKTTPGVVTVTGVPLNLTGGIMIDDGVLSTDSGFVPAGAMTFGTNGVGATTGTLRYRGSSFTLAKPMTVNDGGGIIDITDGATAVNLTGTISGTGSLTKTGPGTVVFSANNSYAGGTTVSAGTAVLNAGSGAATGTGAVAVAAAATLTGTGSIAGPLTLAGTLIPGSPVQGPQGTGILLTPAMVAFQATSLFEVQVGKAITDSNPVIAGTDYDQVALTGAGTTATIASGAKLSVVGLFNLENGQVFTIVDNQTGGSQTGTFSNLAGTPLLDGATVTANDGSEFRINYTGGDVILTATNVVPEPATMGLLGLAAVGLLSRRRRQPG